MHRNRIDFIFELHHGIFARETIDLVTSHFLLLFEFLVGHLCSFPLILDLHLLSLHIRPPAGSHRYRQRLSAG